MNRRSETRRLALCGVLAALALALMFLGGVLPFASIACPVLASLVLIPVYAETGKKWSAVWFLGVAVLAALLAPDKESAVLFAFASSLDQIGPFGRCVEDAAMLADVLMGERWTH